MKPRIVQVGIALCALAASLPLDAAQRTFVSTSGVNNPACSLTAPCRDFAAAISATSVRGEVIVLDSGGYGPVTITQPVSIIASPGVYAGISVFSGVGVGVNAGVGMVVLSGLTINGMGGLTGIDFHSGSLLRIERTTVTGFPSGYGLNTTLSAAASLIIQDSTFIANSTGINVGTSAGELTAKIDGSEFDSNTTGAVFQNNVYGVISGSSFSKNTFAIFAQPFSGATNQITFRNSVVSANAVGIVAGGVGGTTTTVLVTDSEISDNDNVGAQAQAASTVTMSNTTVTRNGTGIKQVGGGSLQSFQDNRLYGNGTDGSFTSTIGRL